MGLILSWLMELHCFIPVEVLAQSFWAVNVSVSHPLHLGKYTTYHRNPCFLMFISTTYTISWTVILSAFAAKQEIVPRSEPCYSCLEKDNIEYLGTSLLGIMILGRVNLQCAVVWSLLKNTFLDFNWLVGYQPVPNPTPSSWGWSLRSWL